MLQRPRLAARGGAILAAPKKMLTLFRFFWAAAGKTARRSPCGFASLAAGLRPRLAAHSNRGGLLAPARLPGSPHPATARSATAGIYCAVPWGVVVASVSLVGGAAKALFILGRLGHGMGVAGYARAARLTPAQPIAVPL